MEVGIYINKQNNKLIAVGRYLGIDENGFSLPLSFLETCPLQKLRMESNKEWQDVIRTIRFEELNDGIHYLVNTDADMYVAKASDGEVMTFIFFVKEMGIHRTHDFRIEPGIFAQSHEVVCENFQLKGKK